jgi:hypothetical protein
MTPPLLKLKTAKHLVPNMFTNKTPHFHLDVLEFLNDPAKFKAMCIFRGAGKTSIVTKVDMFATLFYGHEPYTQIFSATREKAEKFLIDVKQMVIEAIKVGYDIQKGSIWNNSQVELIVDNKHRCYVEVFGAGQDPRGGTYNFSRPTRQVYDDIESKQGLYAVASRSNREKLSNWFWGECIPSLDPTYGKVFFVGTILHEDALLSNILKNVKFKTRIIPLITDKNKSAWQDRHPMTKSEAREKEQEILKTKNVQVEIESVEDIKERYSKEGKLKLFYQEYLCVPQAEESRLFKTEYFKYYSHVEFGEHITEFTLKQLNKTSTLFTKVPKYIVKENGSKIAIQDTIKYATMDLASKDGKDKTVIITCCYDSNNNMYIMPIAVGSWSPSEKATATIKEYKTYNPLRYGIEKASMQNDFFYTIDEVQKANDLRIPVEPISHGGVSKNIRISQLESLFMAGKIYFCKADPQTSVLEAQFLAFDIEIEGSNDDLIDTLAYQYHFIKDRTFEIDDYQEEEEQGIW